MKNSRFTLLIYFPPHRLNPIPLFEKDGQAKGEVKQLVVTITITLVIRSCCAVEAWEPFFQEPLAIRYQSARMPTLRPKDLAINATPKVRAMIMITVMLATSR